jgi:hypothetical protein
VETEIVGRELDEAITILVAALTEWAQETALATSLDELSVAAGAFRQTIIEGRPGGPQARVGPRSVSSK